MKSGNNLFPGAVGRGVLALALGSLAACGGDAPVDEAASAVIDPPATNLFSGSRPILGRYIVVFKDRVGSVETETANILQGRGGELHYSYRHALKGFAATLPEVALPGILSNPNVDYVEEDQTVTLEQVQTQATWGLDRIDQIARPLDTLYHFNYTGVGVYAFIIDTGIRPDHAEFTGRLLPGFNVVPDENGTADCDGHGTHVAGTVGGSTWGVAKGVTLVPVRVLNCKGSGTWSGVIAGVDWVSGQATLRPAVANMSLGGGFSSAVNAAVAGAARQGVTVVVAAGNSNADACRYSPSGEPSAITVGASTSSDARASYSNYGPCLDIFAPGSGITSAWNTGVSANNIISGTSMAAPHVSGVAVLALAAKKTASPAAVASFLMGSATTNQLSSIGAGSPNRLVYSLAPGVPQEPVLRVVSVASLTGSASKVVNGWRAEATVTIRDASGVAVPDATVQGNFAPGGSASCVTAGNGACTLSSGKINKSAVATLMTVTAVTGLNLSFDPDQCAPLTINRP